MLNTFNISDLLPILLHNGSLGIAEYINIHRLLRQRCIWVDFVQFSAPYYHGLGRLKLWRDGLKSRDYNKCLEKRKVQPAYEIKKEFDKKELMKTFKEQMQSVKVEESTRFSCGVEGEIFRDVERTYQTSPVFQEDGIGRDMLTKLLLAFVATFPKVGYCQGMNFVVGTVLYAALCDDAGDYLVQDEATLREIEQVTVEIMVEMVDPTGKLRMGGLWGEKIPQLKLRVFQLDRLLRWNHPRLHAHFTSLNLSPEVITAQWFITLFAYTFTPRITARLWDFMCFTGWEGVFRLAVALLGSLEEDLLLFEDIEGVALLMREWKKTGYLSEAVNLNTLFPKAAAYIINEEVMLKLQETYGMEILSLALMRAPPSPESLSSEESMLGNSVLQGVEYFPPPKDSPGRAHPTPTTTAITMTSSSSPKPPPPLKYWSQEKGDGPAYWLARYSDKLDPRTVLELHNIYQELLHLDEEIDSDKTNIQNKFVTICEEHRGIQERMEGLEPAFREAEQAYVRAEHGYRDALRKGQQVAVHGSVVLHTIQENKTLQKEDAQCTMSSFKKRGPVRLMLFHRKLTQVSAVYEALLQVIRQNAGTSTGHHLMNCASSHKHHLHTAAHKHHHTPPTSPSISTSTSSSSTNKVLFQRPHSTSSNGRRERLFEEEEDDEATTDEMLQMDYDSMVAQRRSSGGNSIRHSSHSNEPLEEHKGISGRGIHSDGLFEDDADDASANHARNTIHHHPLMEEDVHEDEDHLSEAETEADENEEVEVEFTFATHHHHSPSASPNHAHSHDHSHSHSHSEEKEATALEEGHSDVSSSPMSAQAHKFYRYARRWTAVVHQTLPSLSFNNSSSTHNTESPNTTKSTPARALSSDSSSSQSRALSDESVVLNDSKFATLSSSQQLDLIETTSAKAQQRILKAQKHLDLTRKGFYELKEQYEALKTREEELSSYKKHLCDQLQLLVEDCNRGRSQKLLFVAENFLF